MPLKISFVAFVLITFHTSTNVFNLHIISQWKTFFYFLKSFPTKVLSCKLQLCFWLCNSWRLKVHFSIIINNSFSLKSSRGENWRSNLLEGKWNPFEWMNEGCRTKTDGKFPEIKKQKYQQDNKNEILVNRNMPKYF